MLPPVGAPTGNGKQLKAGYRDSGSGLHLLLGVAEDTRFELVRV
jgi:hypothetical protein